MKRIFRIVKLAGWGILSFLGLVTVYLLVSVVLSCIPVNTKQVLNDRVIAIYILTNGVHTDIVVPAKNEFKNWPAAVPYSNTSSKDSNMHYLAMGWGDKGFYLETPEWSDLKFSVAFKAAFYLGNAAMHTTYYKEMREGENCRRIMISEKQYFRLIAYLEKSFLRDSNGYLQHIKADYSYGAHDAFYEATGHYGLFYTCNTWANSALKSCGAKACLWTPADKGIFYHYR